MAEEKDEKTAEEPKKKKGKLILLIGMVVVALLAGGAGAYFYFSKSSPKDKKEESKKEEGVMFPLEPFVVNLGDQGSMRFLKLTIQIELSKQEMADKAKIRAPQMRDSIITLLTSKTVDSIITPEGKLQLKDEISLRLNQILGEGSVRNVFMTDFVMQ